MTRCTCGPPDYDRQPHDPSCPQASSNSSQPIIPSETAALVRQLLVLADWLEVAKLTPNMSEPRCEHWEITVRQAADALTLRTQEPPSTEWAQRLRELAPRLRYPDEEATALEAAHQLDILAADRQRLTEALDTCKRETRKP